jgi:hypothetical protein
LTYSEAETYDIKINDSALTESGYTKFSLPLKNGKSKDGKCKMIPERAGFLQSMVNYISLKYKWKCQIGLCQYMCRTHKEMRLHKEIHRI